MKKLLSIILTCVFVLSSCSDEFFDINQSPNNAVEENMTPSLVLPRAVHRLASKSATGYATYSRWMGYWARCSGTYGPNTDEEAYQITSSFMRTSWLDMYDILKDFDVIEKNATTRNERSYQAIAKIMKSIGYMQLVDQYNNVPYSKAFDLGANMLTPYDKGDAIYADLILQLEQADDLLKNDIANSKVDLDIKTADIVFKGDLAKWRKLGNTQRLRLLMHQSVVLGDAGLKTEVDKIVANGGGFLGAGETAAAQPGYAKDVAKQNPYWNTFNLNDAGGLDNFNRANKYFLDLLKNNGDIRYTYFYSKAVTPKHGDYVGFPFGFDYPTGALDADKDAAANSSNVSGPGIATGPDMAQWFFPSFESLFLQAEAIQRGVVATTLGFADTKTAYETAVTESFTWLKVTNAATTATAYLTAAINPIGNWDAPANTDKLKLILSQKYIAMFGINGLETWTDYRRTGIPSDLPPTLSPSVGSNVIPMRLVYPLEEYQYNKANAVAEGTIDPQTQKIFWDKN